MYSTAAVYIDVRSPHPGSVDATASAQVMPKPSIVDQLVRAAAAIPANIPDDELNRHVADILAKEAKEKESKWREMGIGVYLDDTPG